MNQASFSLRSRNPDVLTCIANLSNDEVFTPPEFANTMLDTLTETWPGSFAMQASPLVHIQGPRPSVSRHDANRESATS